jgi:hypothetical protein
MNHSAIAAQKNQVGAHALARLLCESTQGAADLCDINFAIDDADKLVTIVKSYEGEALKASMLMSRMSTKTTKCCATGTCAKYDDHLAS